MELFWDFSGRFVRERQYISVYLTFSLQAALLNSE